MYIHINTFIRYLLEKGLYNPPITLELMHDQLEVPPCGKYMHSVSIKDVLRQYLLRNGIMEDILKNLTAPRNGSVISSFLDGKAWEFFKASDKSRGDSHLNRTLYVPFMLYYDDYKVGFFFKSICSCEL